MDFDQRLSNTSTVSSEFEITQKIKKIKQIKDWKNCQLKRSVIIMFVQLNKFQNRQKEFGNKQFERITKIHEKRINFLERQLQFYQRLNREQISMAERKNEEQQIKNIQKQLLQNQEQNRKLRFEQENQARINFRIQFCENKEFNVIKGTMIYSWELSMDNLDETYQKFIKQRQKWNQNLENWKIEIKNRQSYQKIKQQICQRFNKDLKILVKTKCQQNQLNKLYQELSQDLDFKLRKQKYSAQKADKQRQSKQEKAQNEFHNALEK